MARRLLSALGIVAMLFAFLPGVVDASLAADSQVCCNGAMCPLHQLMAAQKLCDTTTHDGVLESCPQPGNHYTGALPFVRVAPSIFFSQRLMDSAVLPAPQVSAKVAADIPYPPPRIVNA
jgi:hypothetical protein